MKLLADTSDKDVSRDDSRLGVDDTKIELTRERRLRGRKDNLDFLLNSIAFGFAVGILPRAGR